MDHGLSPPHAAESASIVPRDAFDSHDGDLTGILDELVRGVGATFGVILRYCIGENVGVVLARSEAAAVAVEESSAELAVIARAGVRFDLRRRQDGVNIRQCSYGSGTEGGESWRMLCLSFLPSGSVCVVAAVCRRGAVPFEEPQESIAATLYPFLERHFRLWWLHRVERCRTHALATALDFSDVATMVLDHRAELLFLNAQAAALLNREDGLRRNHQSIASTELEDGARFQAAIQHAIHCNSLDLDRRVERRAPTLSLRRRGAKRPLIATVVSVERRAIDTHDPAAIVYVLDPEQDVQRLLLPVCRIYRLTACEKRLVCHLVNGLDLSEAARQMKIQMHTARSYLKQVFSKTRTNRQADLVRVMLSSMLRTTASVDLTLL